MDVRVFCSWDLERHELALCSGMPFVRGSVSRGNAFAVVKREAVAGGVNDSPVVASRHGGNQ